MSDFQDALWPRQNVLLSCFHTHSEADTGANLVELVLSTLGYTGRVYRLYREEGLSLRRRKRSSRYRGDRLDISRPN